MLILCEAIPPPGTFLGIDIGVFSTVDNTMTRAIDGVPPEPVVDVRRNADVVTLTLSRPRALNAITPVMLQELDAALSVAAADSALRIVVLTGEGRAFSAGVDLKAVQETRQTGGSVGDVFDAPARSVIRRMTTMPQVVIAKVNGHCFTGALELALACDLIVVADEAVLADTHAKWGLRPTWGMSQRLPKLVGMAKARELSYTARSFSGIEAAAWGLAARSVPRERLDSYVEELVEEIVRNSAGSIAAYKDLYSASWERSLDEGLLYEAETRYEIPDSAARIATFQ